MITNQNKNKGILNGFQKSVLDMIKAEHKENIQKSNETKTIVIKLNIEDFKVLDAICFKIQSQNKELIVKAFRE